MSLISCLHIDTILSTLVAHPRFGRHLPIRLMCTLPPRSFLNAKVSEAVVLPDTVTKPTISQRPLPAKQRKTLQVISGETGLFDEDHSYWNKMLAKNVAALSNAQQTGAYADDEDSEDNSAANSSNENSNDDYVGATDTRPKKASGPREAWNELSSLLRGGVPSAAVPVSPQETNSECPVIRPDLSGKESLPSLQQFCGDAVKRFFSELQPVTRSRLRKQQQNSSGYIMEGTTGVHAASTATKHVQALFTDLGCNQMECELFGVAPAPFMEIITRAPLGTEMKSFLSDAAQSAPLSSRLIDPPPVAEQDHHLASKSQIPVISDTILNVKLETVAFVDMCRPSRQDRMLSATGGSVSYSLCPRSLLSQDPGILLPPCHPDKLSMVTSGPFSFLPLLKKIGLIQKFPRPKVDKYQQECLKKLATHMLSRDASLIAINTDVLSILTGSKAPTTLSTITSVHKDACQIGKGLSLINSALGPPLGVDISTSYGRGAATKKKAQKLSDRVASSLPQKNPFEHEKYYTPNFDIPFFNGFRETAADEEFDMSLRHCPTLCHCLVCFLAHQGTWKTLSESYAFYSTDPEFYRTDNGVFVLESSETEGGKPVVGAPKLRHSALIRDILIMIRDHYPAIRDYFIPEDVPCVEAVLTALNLMLSPSDTVISQLLDQYKSGKIVDGKVVFRSVMSQFDCMGGTANYWESDGFNVCEYQNLCIDDGLRNSLEQAMAAAPCIEVLSEEESLQPELKAKQEAISGLPDNNTENDTTRDPLPDALKASPVPPQDHPIHCPITPLQLSYTDACSHMARDVLLASKKNDAMDLLATSAVLLQNSAVLNLEAASSELSFFAHIIREKPENAIVIVDFLMSRLTVVQLTGNGVTISPVRFDQAMLRVTDYESILTEGKSASAAQDISSADSQPGGYGADIVDKASSHPSSANIMTLDGTLSSRRKAGDSVAKSSPALTLGKQETSVKCFDLTIGDLFTEDTKYGLRYKGSSQYGILHLYSPILGEYKLITDSPVHRNSANKYFGVDSATLSCVAFVVKEQLLLDEEERRRCMEAFDAGEFSVFHQEYPAVASRLDFIAKNKSKPILSLSSYKDEDFTYAEWEVLQYRAQERMRFFLFPHVHYSYVIRGRKTLTVSIVPNKPKRPAIARAVPPRPEGSTVSSLAPTAHQPATESGYFVPGSNDFLRLTYADDTYRTYIPKWITKSIVAKDACARLPGRIGTWIDVAGYCITSHFYYHQLDPKMTIAVSSAMDRVHSQVYHKGKDCRCGVYFNSQRVWLMAPARVEILMSNSEFLEFNKEQPAKVLSVEEYPFDLDDLYRRSK